MGLELKDEKSEYSLSGEPSETTNVSEQKKKRKFLKKSSTKKICKKNYNCFSSGKINIKNEWNEFQSGGDEEESSRERSTCQQTELKQSLEEIDRCDVTMSCDLTLNAVGSKNKTDESTDRKICPGNRMGSNTSTCSEGSYSRRKHHKHHKHKQKNKNFMDTEEVINAKVNPIFLWVRQENTRIVEVLCEDYDHRNRLRLTRTQLGWRAIPKTKRFAEAIIPKALPKSKSNDKMEPKNKSNDKKIEPKKLRKIGRRKKLKRRKNKTPKTSQDNLNGIKKCSVALFKNNLINYRKKSTNIHFEDIENKDNQNNEQKYQKEIFNLEPENVSDKKERGNNGSEKKIEVNECDMFNVSNLRESAVGENRIEPEENKEPQEIPQEINFKDLNSLIDNKESNQSEFSLMEFTKPDSDFNEADYDELGQLLKDMPDLEFEQKDVLEAKDQNKLSAATNPTLSKNSESPKVSSPNSLLLPPKISSLITVTAAVNGSSEPLTAPTPEVTITPISSSKKLSEQDKQHISFLDSLIPSIQVVESENKESILENIYLYKTEKKISKHFIENNTGLEISAKKHKPEVIIKNVSKHQAQFSKKKSAEEAYASNINDLLSESSRSDSLSQLKEILSNPLLPVPDPLLVPKARLPALVESPATEIPRLLTMHVEKSLTEKQCSHFTDSDVLEVSLSNLQSLLLANTKELSNYQKSLQTFLEWQKYQTELLEAQMINAKPLSPEFTNDMTDKSSAFAQMFWLPYLRQFDLKPNRDFVCATNSTLSCKYQANKNKLMVPPQINVNQVSQPSPFLTPTSPMDMESHLKTLTMWQEAVLMQQNLQGMQSFCKDLNTATQEIPKAGKSVYSFKKQYSGANYLNQWAKTCREEKCRSGCNLTMEELQKHQRHRNVFHGGIEKHQKLFEAKQRYKWEQSRFRKVQNTNVNLDDQFYPNKLCESSQPENVTLKSVSNNFEKNSNHRQKSNISSFLKEQFKSNRDITSQVAARLQQVNTLIQKTKVKKEKYCSQSLKVDEEKKEIPKLKVKNLVDPNMSPPKLLKQISTEQLPMTMEGERTETDGSQNHLWHPLFGSNQIKNESYSSPWHWTTVTVNGE